MKKLTFVILAIVYCSNLSITKAQVNEKLEVYEKEHIRDKKPVPYVFVREADVVWSKDIWRVIDLRQKMNLPLYYPTKPIGNRMSLIDLLLYAVKNEGVNVYDPDSPEATTEFDVQMTLDQVERSMEAKPDTVLVQNEDGTTEQVITPGRAKTEQVKQFLVKEKWYFDKQHSVITVRIIGLCPIRVYSKTDNPAVLKKKTFWVYYPEARAVLANHEIFNRNNDAQRISFDDFFLQRRFESFIFAESNVYNNRWINEYTQGLQTMLEANRVRDYLFTMEHDLWVY